MIAHRGASGLRPEHTIEAYTLAIVQGADFIEPDLVAAQDRVLIARHENALAQVQLDDNGTIVFDSRGRPVVTGETTDVADHPEFAHLLTVKTVDGVRVGGWFSEDFTLAEIRTLHARERIPEVRPENAAFNDRFRIPTLDEVLLLVQVVEELTGARIGIYAETKHPTFFAVEGTRIDGTPIATSLGQLLVDDLVENGFTDPARVYLQSFEVENLIELQNSILPRAGIDLPLVQLYGDVTDAFVQPSSSFSRPYDMRYNALAGADLGAIYGPLNDLVEGGIRADTGYGDLTTDAVIEHIAGAYAEGLGPWKNSLLLREGLAEPVDGDGDGEAHIASQLNGRVADFLEHAFKHGLLVHPYTLRSEERFLTVDAGGVPQSVGDEAFQLLSLGVNGFFIDQPGDGVRARDRFLRSRGVEPSDLNRFASDAADPYGWILSAYAEALDRRRAVGDGR